MSNDLKAKRRADRAKALVGTPFVRLRGTPPQHQVMFTSHGIKIRVKDVEMVFNDALLIDAVSNWGEDGPLYKDTLDADPPIQREVYEFAQEAFVGVEIPAALKKPIV